MPNVTFSNPDYRDKTVYAVAGSHTETLLSIAREYKIPVNFSCSDGDCGTCVVRVSSLGSKAARMANHLTDREKEVLLREGKLSKEDIENSEVNDQPPAWRLACQMIIRDEDLLIEY